MNVSNAFKTFSKEVPEVSRAWMEAIQKLDSASALDHKRKNLLISPFWRLYGLRADCLSMWKWQRQAVLREMK